MSNKYNNSKIYAIRNTIDDDVYIGSTTMLLCKRMVKHRCDAKKRPDKMKITAKMKDLGIDNFYIELIEEVSCDNIEQLRKKEGEIIREIGTLNTRIECRTKHEYYNDTLEQRKEYQNINREEILRKHREYNDNHREEMREKGRMRYHNDIEKYRLQTKMFGSQKVACDCGGKYTKAHRAEHFRCKKHQDYINNLEQCKNR
jgi:hypothetical protein